MGRQTALQGGDGCGGVYFDGGLGTLMGMLGYRRGGGVCDSLVDSGVSAVISLADTVGLATLVLVRELRGDVMAVHGGGGRRGDLACTCMRRMMGRLKRAGGV